MIKPNAQRLQKRGDGEEGRGEREEEGLEPDMDSVMRGGCSATRDRWVGAGHRGQLGYISLIGIDERRKGFNKVEEERVRDKGMNVQSDMNGNQKTKNGGALGVPELNANQSGRKKGNRN